MGGEHVAFLREAWYIAAWDAEITRSLFAREILGESILMYRREDGAPVAVSNICPHRFAPLDKGRLHGDIVECSYHGLRFDGSGACVLNPHPCGNGPIPPRARLTAYSVLERYGAIWIWMGSQAPDERLMPDLGWLDQPEAWRITRDVAAINAYYELIVDRLLDPAHLPYLTACPAGSSMTSHEQETSQHRREHGRYWYERSRSGVRPSMDMVALNPQLRQLECDETYELGWSAPSHVAVRLDYRTSAGAASVRETGLRIATLLTPMTSTGDRTWQFWSVARNVEVDSIDVDRFIQQTAMSRLEMDTRIVEGQSEMLGGRDLRGLELATLGTDTVAERVRSKLGDMIAKERAAAHSSRGGREHSPDTRHWPAPLS